MSGNKFSIINKKSGISFLAAIGLAFFVFVAVGGVGVLTTNAQSEAVKGLNQTANKAYTGDNIDENQVDSAAVITDIPSAIGKVVGALLSFIGVVFLILMIYGGFMWMLARGNEQEVAKAKDLIFAAVIGLIIVLSAYAITSYIGVNLL